MKIRNIEIPLKPSTNDIRQLPQTFSKSVENEYAERYLSILSVNPTPSNIDVIKSVLPISKSSILPNFVNNTVMIVPGGVNNSNSSIDSFQFQNPQKRNKFLLQKKIKPKKIKSDNIEISNEGNQNTVISDVRRNSWGTVKTFDVNMPLFLELDRSMMQSPSFYRLLYPPYITNQLLLKPLHIFIGSIDKHIPGIAKVDDFLYKKIIQLLSSNKSIQMYGLLCHFSYWLVLHPIIRQALLNVHNLEISDTFSDSRSNISTSNVSLVELAHILDIFNHEYDSNVATSPSPNFLNEKDVKNDGGEDSKSLNSLASYTSLDQFEHEVLFMELLHVLVDIQNQMGYSFEALTKSHLAFINCCHFVVDSILVEAFPWFKSVESMNEDAVGDTYINKSNKIKLQLRRLCHQALADLLDPGRVYTSTSLIASLTGQSYQPLLKSSSTIHYKYFTTSLGVKASLGDSQCPDIRRLMSRGDKPYVPVPGYLKRDQVPKQKAPKFVSFGTETCPNLLEDLRQRRSFRQLIIDRQRNKYELTEVANKSAVTATSPSSPTKPGVKFNVTSMEPRNNIEYSKSLPNVNFRNLLNSDSLLSSKSVPQLNAFNTKLTEAEMYSFEPKYLNSSFLSNLNTSTSKEYNTSPMKSILSSPSSSTVESYHISVDEDNVNLTPHRNQKIENSLNRHNQYVLTGKHGIIQDADQHLRTNSQIWLQSQPLPESFTHILPIITSKLNGSNADTDDLEFGLKEDQDSLSSSPMIQFHSFLQGTFTHDPNNYKSTNTLKPKTSSTPNAYFSKMNLSDNFKASLIRAMSAKISNNYRKGFNIDQNKQLPNMKTRTEILNAIKY